MIHPPVLPHDPLEELFPGIFLVRGEVPLNALLTLSRNMVVVAHEGELTLVDPVRLNEVEERRLLELGEIRRVLRLGPFHGRDDAYYVETFGAELWTPGPSSAYPAPEATRVFDEATAPPFPGATFFCYRGTKQAEAVLLIERDGGLLVSCDGIQHYGDYSHNNLPARLLMPWIGFPRTTILGPFWLKLMTPEGGSLESEFRRLLERPFEHLISAHGTFLRGGAHRAVEAAVRRAFKS
jgi:hypothetical protein